MILLLPRRRRGLEACVMQRVGGQRACPWVCRSQYWGIFPPDIQARVRRIPSWNWKDFSGAVRSGQPEEYVRHGGQLRHWATVEEAETEQRTEGRRRGET